MSEDTGNGTGDLAPVETELTIHIELTDASDFDWLRNKVVPVVEEKVDEIIQEGRLDGQVVVGWSQTDTL